MGPARVAIDAKPFGMEFAERIPRPRESLGDRLPQPIHGLRVIGAVTGPRDLEQSQIVLGPGQALRRGLFPPGPGFVGIGLDTAPLVVHEAWPWRARPGPGCA